MENNFVTKILLVAVLMLIQNKIIKESNKIYKLILLFACADQLSIFNCQLPKGETY